MTRWQEIASQLRDAIVTGQHPPGSKLPKEEELEQRYKVSRTTVRRAIAALTNEGLVRPCT